MSLLAYDADGNVVATLDEVVLTHKVTGERYALDFGAHEKSGGEHLDIWHVDNAAGSKVWPELLDRATDYRVELAGPPGAKHIAALIHKESGVRRARPL